MFKIKKKEVITFTPANADYFLPAQFMKHSKSM